MTISTFKINNSDDTDETVEETKSVCSTQLNPPGINLTNTDSTLTGVL